MQILSMQTTEYMRSQKRKEVQQLLLRIGKGEKEAMSLLYEQTVTAVYALTLSLLKNAHDAQDMTQDTFVRVWESAHSYRSFGSPMAWILTIARNLCLMKLRQAGRHTALEPHEWEALPAQTDGLTTEEKLLLQEALACLGDEERQILLLHAAAGLKHREIAELLELPLATVLSKYHRAIKKVKRYAKGDGAL